MSYGNRSNNSSFSKLVFVFFFINKVPSLYLLMPQPVPTPYDAGADELEKHRGIRWGVFGMNKACGDLAIGHESNGVLTNAAIGACSMRRRCRRGGHDTVGASGVLLRPVTTWWWGKRVYGLCSMCLGSNNCTICRKTDS